MARRILAVFCYDVSNDRVRRRLADLLSDDAARVQESVFEGWMSERRAEALAGRAVRLIGPQDSLRLYLLAERDALRTRVFGAGPPVEAHEFALL